MYFSLEWLSEWLGEKPDPRDLGARLTMAGLEVDSVTPVASSLSGIVTARIEQIDAHPNADRLKLCMVDAGGAGVYKVVCGAPNIYAGMCVPFAAEGAKIGSRRIAAAKIRGVESAGMLCSGEELGLSEDATGLLDLGDVRAGIALGEYIPLDDVVYKLDLTPNRADCFSIVGIAREVAALYRCDLRLPDINAVEQHHWQKANVTVTEAEACPLYISRVITGLDCTMPIPFPIRERLRRCGIRSVHPIADILNYVMLELGQPMHAFDRNKIQGALRVCYAEADEKMATIGGEQLHLSEEDLVIRDERRVQALAGVVGAETSAVDEQTTAVVLECAFFTPRVISGRMRAHKLQTESAHRFERGVDFCLPQRALERATGLICEWVGGTPGPVSCLGDSRNLPQCPPISLTADGLKRRLGVAIEENFIERGLSAIGCELKADISGGWECKPPSWRFDLNIEDDLIEEIGRLYGYDRIPEDFHIALEGLPQANHKRQNLAKLREHLTATGYHEAVTYSLIDEALQRLFSDCHTVVVKNPIAGDMSGLCATLLPGLVRSLAYNLRRQFERVRLFQTGNVFAHGNSEVNEHLSLAGVACGLVAPEQWHADKIAYDFYHIKGDVERLLSPFDEVSFVAGAHKAFHPGQCADIMLGAVRIGCAGQLAPQLERACEIDIPVFMFELDVSLLPGLATRQYKFVSTYPSIRRDLAVSIPIKCPVGDLVKCIQAVDSSKLQRIVIFDIFIGEAVGSGYKSVGVGLIFQDPNRTMESKDSDVLTEEIIDAIQQFGGFLRRE